MGVRLTQMDSKFFLAAEHKQAALIAARPVHGGWVKDGDTKKCRTLEELFEVWGYRADTDELGNITDLSFEMEKLGEEEKLWNAIAPFVRAGSFLTMSAEHSPFRWKFDGATCIEQSAKVSFD